MRVLSRRVDVAEVRPPSRRFRLPFGNREMAVIKGKDNHLTWSIKAALWDMVDTKRKDLQMADHSPIDDESVMRLVITIPANSEGVKEIEDDVRDQLDREGYEEAFPNLTYSFAPARFPVSSSDHHMFISMVYPLRSPEIPSIERIMGKSDGGRRFGEDESLDQIGFGTGHFMPQNGSRREDPGQHSYLSRGRLRRIERDQERENSRSVTADDQYGNSYNGTENGYGTNCLLYTSPSPRD